MWHSLYLGALSLTVAAQGAVQMVSYHNPILPGWHSDPSCVFVPEWDNIFFCTTSTFLAFPGIPIYSSRDLTHWKLISHVLNHQEQLPELGSAGYQSDGIYASTLRFHRGSFYLATAFLNGYNTPRILVFTANDPYDDEAWSDPLDIPVTYYGYDPDIFWDVDDQLYITYAAYNTSYNTEIIQATLDLESRTTGTWETIWTGTGAPWPEGPHIYRKNGLYYLMIAEGGTGLNHSVTIARASSVRGPYTSYSNNPILTNNNTASYFQTVGHADLFQDKTGAWWGVALSTRSGPEWKLYPMGRETVIYPGTWEEGGWPKLKPVSGSMSGPLPPQSLDVPGTGPFVQSGDAENFLPGTSLPKQFLTWRPQSDLFTISPAGHSGTLRITPSSANLTGDSIFAAGNDTQPLAFISRLQTSTLFKFSVDIRFRPVTDGEEAGISVFLDQLQHVDLGILLTRSTEGRHSSYFRFRSETSGLPDVVAPPTSIVAIPQSWLNQPIRLQITTPDDTTYVFSASAACMPSHTIEIGRASAEIVSGGEGKFTGALLGVYTTTNGGNGATPSYVRRWRYTPIAQKISAQELVYIDAM